MDIMPAEQDEPRIVLESSDAVETTPSIELPSFLNGCDQWPDLETLLVLISIDMRAAAVARQALDGYRELVEATPDSLAFKHLAAEAYLRLLRCQLATGQFDEMVRTGAEAESVVLAGLSDDGIEDAPSNPVFVLLSTCCQALRHHAGQERLAANSPGVATLLAWYAYVDASTGHAVELSATMRDLIHRVPGAEQVRDFDELFAVARAVPDLPEAQRQTLCLTEFLTLAMRARNAATQDGVDDPRVATLCRQALDALDNLQRTYPQALQHAMRYEPEAQWFWERPEVQQWLTDHPSP